MLFNYSVYHVCNQFIELKMLQPRSGKNNFHNMCKMPAKQKKNIHQTQHLSLRNSGCELVCELSLYLLVIAIMTLPALGSAQSFDGNYIVKPTPALRISAPEGLYTVLLVNNDREERLVDSQGRFLSVRPEVGLLTSTARTFIQEGITTEYATEVVGTTLNNGRLYAQYLKMSSRVLFDNRDMPPSVVTSWVGDGDQLHTRAYYQSHNDLLNADVSAWQDIDDRIRFSSLPLYKGDDFVGNTNSLKVKSAKQPQPIAVSSSLSLMNAKEISGPNIMNLDGYIGENTKLTANKVLRISDLPTFTVKNNFEPSGHQTREEYFGSISDKQILNDSNLSSTEKFDSEIARFAKLTYKHTLKLKHSNEIDREFSQSQSPSLLKKILTTITYYGFADFTTAVGDSIIVFSPSSVQSSAVNGLVTSITGMATLLNTDLYNATITDEGHLNESIPLLETSSEPNQAESNSNISELDSSEVNLSSTEQSTMSLNVVSSERKPMFSLPTDQEIQEIYASLSKAHAPFSASEKFEQTQVSDIEDKSSNQRNEGATTIFAYDDPFANFITPTIVIEKNTTEINRENASDVNIINSILEVLPSDQISFVSVVLDETNSIIKMTSKSPNKLSESLLNEITNENNMEVKKCDQVKPQVISTQVPKLITVLSTHILDNQSQLDNGNLFSIRTSIYSTNEILETTTFNCIQASQVIDSLNLEILRNTDITVFPIAESSIKFFENIETIAINSQSEQNTDVNVIGTTLANDYDYNIQSDKNHLSENGDDDFEIDDESDEVDIIYKTLYTTYTYLTTFFQDESSTVSSHTEIVTNLITLTPGTVQDTVTTTKDIINRFTKTSVFVSETNNASSNNASTASLSKYIIPEELNMLLYASTNNAINEKNFMQQSIHLDDAKLSKTLHTTFTYYTTIFAENEIDVVSRTEVITNYITDLGSATISSSVRNLPNRSMELVVDTIPISTSVTSLFASESTIQEVVNVGSMSTITTLVTSQLNTTYEQPLAFGKLKNSMDDQVTSESNTDEILPSPTLLLQTSFTTFTFYTTMYVDNITNIVSRLETVSNIGTETLQPTKASSQEEALLPITYFTTFTYWTKLAKDGEINTISREETISNVIAPTKPAITIETSPNFSLNLNVLPTTIQTSNLDANSTNVPDITTYYTTYTYYTTSYDTNNTITTSHLETITNIMTSTINTLPIIISATPTHPESPIMSDVDSVNKKSDLVLYDYKRIVDSNGISTLYFTTHIQSAVNNEGNGIEITSSTSSLYIDETKKSNLALFSELDDQGEISTRQYKTGLVRLIEGTRIGNSTTTLYQSRVIGTIIDNRYAQIIESTSSFLFEKAIPLSTISLNGNYDNKIESTQTVTIQSSPENTIESSINNASIEHDVLDKPDDDIDENAEDNDNNPRFPFQSKKRTFAPVIRPFASRNRPTFAPKQKNFVQSSVTIITRSDITPTITATPALKSVNRYSLSRRGGVSKLSINPNDGSSPSSSRRIFGRPIKPLNSLGHSQLSISSSILPLSRNIFSSSPRAASTPPSSRRLSIRPSSSSNFRPSSLNITNSRQRINPTSAIGKPTTTSTTFLKQSNLNAKDIDEELQTPDEEDTPIESSKRNQKPLLQFRRPLSRPSGFTPITRPSAITASVSTRKNPLSERVRTTTKPTTTTTTTSRSRSRNFQRPIITNSQAGSRSKSNLFPPRGLLQSQQQKQLSVNGTEYNKIENNLENSSEYEDGENAEDDGDSDTDVENESERRKRSFQTFDNSTIRKRVRRQAADTLNRNRFRYHRAKGVTTVEPSKEDAKDGLNETTSRTLTRQKVNSRFGSRYQASSINSQQTTTTDTTVSLHRSIRPTRPTAPRTQFTLRDKDTILKSNSRATSSSPHNRRQQPMLRRNRAGSNGATTSSRHLKSYTNHNHNNNNLDSNGLRSSNTSRPRNSNTKTLSRGRGGTKRGRIRNDYSLDLFSTDLHSMTITVTHVIPAEVTVPVINGQVTEYKNILTGKSSLEILGPHQYTQIVGNNGLKSLYLTREDSNINLAGATEITRYLIHDSATTTVTFTPTTIRGRKTSFSHILPSTVYSIENIVSTLQPQIASNAPLANILLSQLLLGNINLPANPLFGVLGHTQASGLDMISVLEPSIPPAPQPITEYRTHSTTYVTTIYDGKSTILPITFQGKKILTTVFDTTAQTITATEYSVDTIINTPSVQQQQLQPTGGQVAQVNSLLLQQLLLQQQQQSQQIGSITQTTTSIFKNENLQNLDDATRLDTYIDGHDNVDNILITMDDQIDNNVRRKKLRKLNKSHKNNKQQRVMKQEEKELEEVEVNSIVTLYVSGRRPGEFSTILSTVYNSYDDRTVNLQKRQAIDQIHQTLSLHRPKYLAAYEEDIDRFHSAIRQDDWMQQNNDQ